MACKKAGFLKLQPCGSSPAVHRVLVSADGTAVLGLSGLCVGMSRGEKADHSSPEACATKTRPICHQIKCTLPVELYHCMRCPNHAQPCWLPTLYHHVVLGSLFTFRPCTSNRTAGSPWLHCLGTLMFGARSALANKNTASLAPGNSRVSQGSR